MLLPEFLPTGYELNSAIWESAEPREGVTARWLRGLAIRYGVWIGTSFLEADGHEFFNTFMLVDPSGRDSIRVRKSKPAATEAFLFAGSPSPRVVETPLGRIGVSICYEATLAATMHALSSEDADLVLMPMSAPTPTLNAPLTEQDLAEYNDAIRVLASSVARTLGVPAIMANKVGKWRTAAPWPFPSEDSTFPGLSRIVTANGEVLAQAGDQECVLVAEVSLDPALKARRLPRPRGKWARKPPRLFRLFLISETWGWLRYVLGVRRRKLARMKARPDRDPARDAASPRE